MAERTHQSQESLPAPARRRWWSDFFGPQYILLLIFAALLAVLTIISSRGLSIYLMSVEYALYMILIFTAVSFLKEFPRLLRGDVFGALRHSLAMIRDWLPFVICLWIYENLHDLTMWINADTVDAALAAADEWLFGVQPTLALEKIADPYLTDWLAIAYLSYFVTPPLLAGWLYLRGHVYEFKEYQIGLLVSFYLGFLGYILVPAIGPENSRFFEYDGPLPYVKFFWGAKAFVEEAQKFPRDCFPSMHTAISTMVLYFSFRNRARLPIRRIALPVITVITLSLWFATVYLRYHWVVDIFAGWAVAVAASAAGIWLQRKWPGGTRPSASGVPE